MAWLIQKFAQVDYALKRNRTEFNSIALLLILVALIYSPAIANQITYSGDYAHYMAAAYQWGTDTAIVDFPPHFLTWFSIAIFYKTSPLGLIGATVFAMLSYYVLMAAVVYGWLRGAMLPMTRRKMRWLILLVVTVMTFGAISGVLFFSTRDYLLNYIQASQHHNPTSMVARSFNLMTFILAMSLFQVRRGGKTIALSAVVIVVSAFAKPSWLIAFLPALVVWLALRFIFDRMQPDWRMVIAGLILPAIAVLIGQFLFTFGSQAESSIALAPFQMYLRNGNTFPAWGVALILSTLFPLILVVSQRDAWRDPAVQLGWLVFGMALLQGILFNESGPRSGHGNFLWGAVIALWILFVASLRYLLAQYQQDTALPLTQKVCWFVFALHGVMGFLWLIAHYVPRAVLLH